MFIEDRLSVMEFEKEHSQKNRRTSKIIDSAVAKITVILESAIQRTLGK